MGRFSESVPCKDAIGKTGFARFAGSAGRAGLTGKLGFPPAVDIVVELIVVAVVVVVVVVPGVVVVVVEEEEEEVPIKCIAEALLRGMGGKVLGIGVGAGFDPNRSRTPGVVSISSIDVMLEDEAMRSRRGGGSGGRAEVLRERGSGGGC